MPRAVHLFLQPSNLLGVQTKVMKTVEMGLGLVMTQMRILSNSFHPHIQLHLHEATKAPLCASQPLSRKLPSTKFAALGRHSLGLARCG